MIERHRLAAEFVGTCGLVFAGTGAIIINEVSGGTVGHVGIGLTFGLIVMVMIYAFGHVSGAHLNPAVTLAFAAGRHFPWPLVPLYWAAQLAGGITASLILKTLFGDVAHLGTTLPAGSARQSFGLEIVLTLILMVVITAVATDTRGRAGGSHRHRRHDRAGGALCWADLGSEHEPGPLPGPRARFLDLAGAMALSGWTGHRRGGWSAHLQLDSQQ